MSVVFALRVSVPAALLLPARVPVAAEVVRVRSLAAPALPARRAYWVWSVYHL